MESIGLLIAEKTQAFATRLVAWFDSGHRDLPWRRTRSPYRIWVSEIMLQQTQVSTVIPYYRRFFRAFPTMRALAEADEADVLRAWEGLGYYSRARNLHASARAIMERNGGRFPRRYEDARALPGVGAYTAGAVLSIAFGQRIPAIDGNAVRVLARVFGVRGDVSAGAGRRRMNAVGTAAVPHDRPGDYNQAVMELGALVCLSRAPRCDQCPLLSLCDAREAGEQEAIPAPRDRARTEKVRTVAAVLRRGYEVLIARRPEVGVWAGLWAFPSKELAPAVPPEAAAEELARGEYGLQVGAGERLATIHHSVMNQRVHLTAVACKVLRGRVTKLRRDDAKWVSVEELRGYALPAPHRTIADVLQSEQSPTQEAKKR